MNSFETVGFSYTFIPSDRIDCAGILKLRNADIELRKGETDVGRKNTRVRLVFRVHIPQPGGQHVSLQVASHPIECCKRIHLKHSHSTMRILKKQDKLRHSAVFMNSPCTLPVEEQNFTQNKQKGEPTFK